MEESYLGSKISLDVPYITFPELLKRRANEFPNKAAYVFVDRQGERSVLTFGELFDKATKFSKSLVQLGVKKGNVVGLSGRNVPEWLIAHFGIQMAGGCPLCFPFRHKEGKDVAELFKSIGNITMLIFDPGLEGQNCAIVDKLIEGLLDSNSALERVISFYPCDKTSITCTILDSCTQDLDVDLPRLDPEDLGLILLTSGSTGTPKAIPDSHHNLVVRSWQYLHALSTHNDEDIFYNDRPFYWGGGYLQWEIAKGATRVTLQNPLESASILATVEIAAENIQKEGITIALLVPSMIEILRKRKIPLKVSRIVTGGMVAFSSLLECLGTFCDELQVLYAMTEFNTIGSRIYSLDDRDSYTDGVLSCRPIPGVELKVTDENGYLLPVGQRGQIFVRSSKRFTGYLNNKKHSLETVLRTGWWCSEDGGYITADSALVVEGRVGEMIQVYGCKIYPFQIENVIKSKSNITDAIVLPMRDKESGDHPPCAAIIYRKGGEEDIEWVQGYVREEFNITKERVLLESLYVPRVIVKFKEFPLTASGKPDRHAIKLKIQEAIDCEKYECIF